MSASWGLTCRMWALSEDKVWALELLKKGWTVMHWCNRHHYFFSWVKGSSPLVQCHVERWDSGGDFYNMPLLCLQKSSSLALLGNSWRYLQKVSDLRQKGSEKLPTLLLCLKRKKKNCHWSLLVHHCPLQLSLPPLAFMSWDKYRLCAGSSLPTHKIIYCYDSVAICRVFIVWLHVVIDVCDLRTGCL